MINFSFLRYLLIFYQTEGIFFYYLKIFNYLENKSHAFNPSPSSLVISTRIKTRQKTFLPLLYAIISSPMNITSTITGRENKINRTHPIEPPPPIPHRYSFKFQTRQTPMAANSSPLSAFQSPSKSSRSPPDSSNHSNSKLPIKRRLCRAIRRLIDRHE